MTYGTETKVEIKWAYTPADFLEEKISLERDGYSIEIENGQILAQMTESHFTAQPGIREMIAAELDTYFLGLNLSRRKPFGIQGGTLIRIFPDGHRDITIVMQEGIHVQVAVSADVVIVDNDGRVIRDLRRDRIEAAKRIAQLSVKHSGNPTVRKILASYYNSVKDPGNELVYLYEIWEALMRELGKKADKAIGVQSQCRKRLEKLACKNLIQGRHRGRFLRLRDATPEELNEARAIAQDMITRFLAHLEAPQPRP